MAATSTATHSTLARTIVLFVLVLLLTPCHTVAQVTLPTTSAIAPASPSLSTSPSVELVPGAKLEVWSVRPETAATFMAVELPLAVILDAGPFFKLSSYAKGEGMQPFAGKDLAFRWSGFIRVSSAGKHLIALELANDKALFAQSYSTHPYGFVADLSIKGDPVLQVSVKGDGGVETVTKTIEFAAGYYEFIALPSEPEPLI